MALWSKVERPSFGTYGEGRTRLYCIVVEMYSELHGGEGRTGLYDIVWKDILSFMVL